MPCCFKNNMIALIRNIRYRPNISKYEFTTHTLRGLENFGILKYVIIVNTLRAYCLNPTNTFLY